MVYHILSLKTHMINEKIHNTKCKTVCQTMPAEQKSNITSINGIIIPTKRIGFFCKKPGNSTDMAKNAEYTSRVVVTGGASFVSF